MSDEVKQLKLDDYAKVQEAMWEARCQWFNIGVHFHLNIDDLNAIDIDSGDVDEKFNKMLHTWFRNGENRTWEAICDVLQHITVGWSCLANKVRAKFAKVPPAHAEDPHAPEEKRCRVDLFTAGNQVEGEEKNQSRSTNGGKLASTHQEFTEDKVHLHSLSESDTPQPAELQASSTDSVTSAPTAQQQSAIQPKSHSDESGNTTPEKIEETKKAIDQLEKNFDELVIHAQDDMSSNKVDVRHLRHSITRLPGDLKDEHEQFLKEKKEEIRKAENVEDVFLTADDYWDFLNYSLLQHLIDRHASDNIKEEMEEHDRGIKVFRKETFLCTFSKAYKRKPKQIDHKFREMVTEHQMDWSVATLEDVEQFRNCICSEISLRKFCLKLAAVTLGSVVITWLVSASLVAHIEKAIRLNSQCLRIYHVSRLTIDGRIIYDGSAAMHTEHKVVRLEREILHVNYTYLLDQMVPEMVVTQLVARRLLTNEKVKEVMDKSDWNQRLTTILDAVLAHRVVGTLPTLCAALCDTLGHEQYGKKLDTWFHSLLRGDTPPQSPTPYSDDVMIPGKASTPPAPPPPGNLLITAQVETTALTQAQYNTTRSLMCSLLHLPTGDLVFDGYTLNPFTLHWHCAGVDEKRVPCFPLGIVSNMINQCIKYIRLGAQVYCLPHENEMALLESSWDGDMKRAQHVLESGANADTQMPDGWNSMMYAALLGHDTIMEMLLQYGASVHTTNKDGASALLVAACQGHTPVVRRLLHAKADPNQKSKIGKTPLICAAQKGYEEVVDVLLKNHATVDIKKNDGTRALTIASCQGHAPVVKKLLNAGAHPDLENKAGTTPLMCAAQNGHEDVVSILLEHKAKVDIKRKDGRTALTVAILRNHVPVVKKLLEANADPEQEIENGETFLMRAAKDNSSEMVENLLKYRADPNRQDKDGRTPLMWAALNGNENMVLTLLHYHARVNFKDKDGKTALAEAFLGDHVAVVEKLLAAHADPEQENIEGESFLTIAARYGRNEMAEKLLTYLADPNKQDEDGWTPLMWAAGRGDENLVKTLLHHGARVNIKTISGWTALMFAAQEAQESVVEILIENGADINIDNNCGFTALMVAIYHKSSTVLDVLFKHRPDVDTMAVGGFSALAYACWNEDLRSVHSLLALGADPNVCAQDGKTPLLMSVRKGNIDIAEELLDAKADPNYMDEAGGLSALMLSCAEGGHDMVKLLLKAQADPNLQQLDTGWTALMFASRQGHVEIVKTLMLHNSKASTRNMEGLTAFDIASVGEQSDVCTVLQEHTPQDTTEEPARWMGESKDIEEVIEMFLKKMDYHPPFPDTDRTRVMRFD